MTPPPASHVAEPQGISLGRARETHSTPVLARLLVPHAWSRLRLFIDVLVLYFAAGAAVIPTGHSDVVIDNPWLVAVFPLLAFAILRGRRSPDEGLNGSIIETEEHVVGAVSLAAMLVLALDSIFGGQHPVALALRLWLFSVVYVGLERAMLLSIRRNAVRNPALSTRTLVIGAGLVGEHLVQRLIREPRYGLRPVGFLDADPLPRPDHDAGPPVPVLGGPDNLAEALEVTGAGHVIVAFSAEPDYMLVEKVRECEQAGVDVSLVPRLYESINNHATLDHIGGVPLVSLHPVDPRGWQFVVKHSVDRAFAFLALVALAPLMLAISIAVKVSSPGPILFRQRRVGRDGHEFDVLKFRTMRGSVASSREFTLPDGCAPGGIEGKDRRTQIGRWLRDLSLDELPQFINVLRGDMSLVGPRPERPEYVELFTRDIARYEDRHRVKSGITGWAQVNGLRGQTSIADRVEWDNYYIQNWSLRLDLRIIALTIAEVLRFRE